MEMDGLHYEAFLRIFDSFNTWFVTAHRSFKLSPITFMIQYPPYNFSSYAVVSIPTTRDIFRAMVPV